MSRISKVAQSVLARTLSDRAYSIVHYNYLRLKAGRLPRLPDLQSPMTFNEKILYLKLYYRHRDAHIYADKYAVREFVADSVGQEFLIPLIGAFDDPDSIEFDKLPSKFVLKPNHASGLVLFCDKEKGFDRGIVRNTLKKWLLVDYYKEGKEYQYRDVPRKIVIEEMLIDDNAEGGLRDYKFFCFNGEPRIVQVDMGRFSFHGRNFYDLSWHRLPFGILYPQCDRDAEKPVSLQEMIMVAKTLSKEFVFSRVDLYELDGQVYFGEITFHPGSGTEPFSPENYDEMIGSYLRLPA